MQRDIYVLVSGGKNISGKIPGSFPDISILLVIKYKE